MSSPGSEDVDADRAALLTVAEMAAADRLAITGGVPGERLMEEAGRAVAVAAARRWTPRPTVVLCGPGNNGGDGFVAARHLARAGWPVRVALLGDRSALAGDAARHAGRWTGAVEPLGFRVLDGAALVVDALFGAGLSRPLDGVARATVEAVSVSGLPVLAVDVPSGVDGNTGRVSGAAAAAALTVTFFRRKPGHLLEPGRSLAGETRVADIGIPAAVLGTIGPSTWENGPALWRGRLPGRGLVGHKYGHGHAVVVAGATLTGAGRLAALAAARVGAGLVTVAAPAEAIAIYAGASPALLMAPLGAAGLDAVLADPRRNAILLGPGGGAGPALAACVLRVLETGRATVLDADALTSFAGDPALLFGAVAGPTVLTPHEGEFQRLFPGLSGDKLARARAAAAASGAVVVLKGRDTVIAAPDGRAAINANAPPTLATAGTGDVLAGLVLGLLARGVPAFEAATAAVWIHGDAALRHGAGLLADDLPGLVPAVLDGLGTAP